MIKLEVMAKKKRLQTGCFLVVEAARI